MRGSNGLRRSPQPGFLSQESPANLFGVRAGVIFLRCMIPQTELAMRGSYGLGKGPLKGLRALVANFDQEKTVLGDTCSRLA